MVDFTNLMFLKKLNFVTLIKNGLFVLFVTLVSTSFSQNTKPFVIPELREWQASNGVVTISDKTALVIEKNENSAIKQVAQSLSDDYFEMFGTKLKVKTGAAASGDIQLKISSKLLKDKGNESYKIDIGNTIVLSANTIQGLYWSTRTILQLAEQSKNLPKGIIQDYPAYPVRGFMLDAGRKYFSMDYLRSVVKMMSYYKMNTFQVHLNDNGFKQFFDNDWDKTYAAFRLESETYPGLAAKDGHYTKKEFRQFQIAALRQGVTIIPEIDAPAHTLAFGHYMPEIASDKYGKDHLDLFNPKTYEFLNALYKEYLGGKNPVFVNEYVHIGTDEYSNRDTAVVEKFRYFTDYYIKYIESFGKKAAMWGALTHAKGKTPVKAKDVLMYCWYNGYAQPRDMIKDGYDLLSVPDGFLYIVPAAGYYYDYLNIRNLYENWTPAHIGKEVFEEQHPQIKGGMFAVWNDHAGNGISYQDIHHRLVPAMQTLSVKMWDGKNITVPFKEFNERRNLLSEAPGLNLLARPNGKKAGLVFENKAPQKNKKPGTITDIGYNYRVSFDLLVNDNPKGTVLFSSKHSKFYLTDPREGKLGFSRDGYDYTFNYKIPVGTQTKISIEGTNKTTKLFVNGELKETLSVIPKKDSKGTDMKMFWVQTLVFPLEKVGDFLGTMQNLKVEYLGF